jgi:YhcH/YjgK/YiaL family protein
MIHDHLDRAHLYFPIADGIETALRFLQRTDLATLSPGRHDVDGGRIYCVVAERETLLFEDTFWEVHRKYIDVQYLQRGVERMGYAPIARMQVGAYDDELDYCRCEGDGDFIRFESGYFMILGPGDVHMPGLMADGRRAAVRRLVVKVAVS